MVDKADMLTEEQAKRRPLLVDLIIRLVKEKPLGVIGGVIVLIMFFSGIFADFLAPYGMTEAHPRDSLSPPSSQYLLGTDTLGRDLLSRVIYGARISMIVGLAGAGLTTFLAAIIGIISGFTGGKLDMLIQRFVDTIMCFPALFVILTVMAIMGQGLTQVIIVLGLNQGIRQSRVVRSAVIGIKENIYIEAAVAMGSPTWRILFRHILPNVAAPIIIVFTIMMGHMILAEATVSFLGFGIPPPIPSWGGMISQEGRRLVLKAPWLAIWPGLALSIAVFGINMLGDAVRDLLDPRLRGGLGRYGRATRKKNRKGGNANPSSTTE